jgi:hypothetical protein
MWVQHASIHVKKYWNSKSKKVLVIVKVSDKIYSELGMKPDLEPEPKEIFAALRSRSRKKDFRLCNTALDEGLLA